VTHRKLQAVLNNSKHLSLLQLWACGINACLIVFYHWARAAINLVIEFSHCRWHTPTCELNMSALQVSCDCDISKCSSV